LYDKDSLGAQKYEELCREILGLPLKATIAKSGGEA